MIAQRTLKRAIHATGVGVHTGQKILMTLKPAPVDSGIVFHRIDGNEVHVIPAKAALVKDTRFCTALVAGDARVGTVEHLLSALAGLGVDNAIIEVDADEIPIMDGSSAPFVFLIQSAGITEQSAPKRFLKVVKPIFVESDDKWVRIEPYDGFKISFSIDFNHPIIKQSNQSLTIDFGTTSYLKEVSRARTFGFLKDFEWLQANNLAKGGSLDNAIVLDDFKVLNEDGLRFDDEFVRHKVLDAIGDLYLLGAPVLGSFVGHKSGHALNNQLALTILADESAYEWVTAEDMGETGIQYDPLESWADLAAPQPA